MTAYTANITRDGHWWMIHVPEIDGLTQARHLVDAESMARELIAVTCPTSAPPSASPTLPDPPA